MRKIMIILLCLLFWSCQSYHHEFKEYEKVVKPVKLGLGTLSRDSVQWNNAYVSATKELYFTKMGKSGSNIYKMDLENGVFKNLQKINLPEGSPHSDVYVSPSGDLMLFSSILQDHETDTIMDWNIWKSQRINGQWQKPTPFFKQNVEGNQFYPWLTNSGNLYMAITPHGSENSDLHVSKFNEGRYITPIPLAGSINTLNLEGDAFVAHDESYLIFAGFDREGGLGKSDLYISFNNSGMWSKPIWLEEGINSEGYDGSPFVTQDGKYLILTSSRGSTDEKTFFNHYIVRLDLDKYKSKNELQSHEYKNN